MDARQIQRERTAVCLLSSETVILILVAALPIWLVFIWLISSHSVYLLRYKSCHATRVIVERRRCLSHCFGFWAFCYTAVKLNIRIFRKKLL